MSLIRLSGVTKSYPDGENRLNHVLRGVEADVARGEFVAIKGVSGSGKTTLLSILGTLLRPDAGSYLLDGREMLTPGVNHAQVRNRTIGFVFQDHRLLPQYNVRENILLPTLASKAAASPEEEAYALQLMELTGIAAVAGQYPATLSGGESSRTALCRALMMKPLLILADEPTGQLDADNAKNIASLLSVVNRSLGTTIVMATHSDAASAAAHRVFRMQKGVLISD